MTECADQVPCVTPHEQKILEWMRSVLSPETRSITFFTRAGVIRRAEAEECCPADSPIHTLIGDDENQDITTKYQDGKPVSVTIRRKTKL